MSDLVIKKDNVKKIIRSLLISAPNGLTVSQLEKDYFTTAREKLHYVQFGHTDLLGFVKSMPDVIQIEQKGNSLILQGIADENTKHVKSMVQKQRKNKLYTSLNGSNPNKKTSISNISIMGNAHSSPRLHSCIPACVQRNIYNLLLQYPEGISMSDFHGLYKEVNGVPINTNKMGFENLIPFFLLIPDIARLEFGQMDGQGNNVYLFPRKVKTELSITGRKVESLDMAAGQENLTDESKCDTKSEKLAENNLCKVQELPQIEMLKRQVIEIISNKTCGVWSRNLFGLFKQKHGHEMNLSKHGYFSVIEFVSTISDKICISRPDSQGDWILSLREAKEDNFKKMGSASCSAYPEDGLEILKMEIKDLLLKAKDGIPLDELEEIYAKVYEHEIDYEKYNIKTLVNLVLMIPEGCIYNKNDKRLVTLSEQEKLNCQNIVSSPYKSSIPSDAVGPGCHYVSPYLPPAGNYTEVFVSEIKTPGHFYVQICGRDTTEALDEVMDCLEKCYCSQEGDKYKMPPSMICEGMICAAVFYEDMNWHRAMIVSQIKNGFVGVLYIDYGSRSNVTVESLRLLKSCFMRLPFQMIQSKLAFICPKNLESWTLAGRESMLDICRDKALVALITNVENHLMSLCLCDSSKVSGKEVFHINHTLVKMGHAVYDPELVKKIAEKKRRCTTEGRI